MTAFVTGSLRRVPNTRSQLKSETRTRKSVRSSSRSWKQAFHPGADRSGSSAETRKETRMVELKIPFTEPRNRSRRRGSGLLKRTPALILSQGSSRRRRRRRRSSTPIREELRRRSLLSSSHPLSTLLAHISLSLLSLSRHPLSPCFPGSLFLQRDVSLFPFRATVT